MSIRTLSGVGLLLALLLACGDALGAGVLLSNEYRYAAKRDKSLVRGEATVAESRVLPNGLRLAAPAAKDAAAADAPLATAIYLFDIPLAAKSITIEVGYRPDAASKDQEVAGLLFVRNCTMEATALGSKGKEPAKGDKPAEPAFLGNLYFLKGGDTSTSVTLPADDHMADGVLEVHLSAAAGQAFDAQYVQVSAHRVVTNYTAPFAASAGQGADPLRVPGYDRGSSLQSNDPFFWRQFDPYPRTYYLLIRHRHHHDDKDKK